jgi:hypothetical protein
MESFPIRKNPKSQAGFFFITGVRGKWFKIKIKFLIIYEFI